MSASLGECWDTGRMHRPAGSRNTLSNCHGSVGEWDQCCCLEDHSMETGDRTCQDRGTEADDETLQEARVVSQ